MLTYEELTTLLYQIEACLNSRPITQLSTDPKELNALTPGHFLTGRAPALIPEPLTTKNKTPTNRWRYVTSLMHNFWRRWSAEYLHLLHSRPKWQIERQNIQKDDLVLVRSDLHPPGKWPLARVVETHPDKEGRVRCVTLKTAKSTCRLAIHKLIPLNT